MGWDGMEWNKMERTTGDFRTRGTLTLAMVIANPAGSPP